jgi:3'-phosphoadenosine 5'-phosphosulfate sulfotransferase (PAPS reductase)/FAD synthetase
VIALAFSGGKDSWACLHLMKDQIDVVLWVNTGKNYPEALEAINLAKKMCKAFIEIKSDRDTQNAVNGIPSDIIPFANTQFAQQVTGHTETKIQSYFGCCYDNITLPLMAKVKQLGVTYLVSGKRNDEGHVSSSKDGDVIDGVTHLHPIENWTRDQVLEYLESKMQVPEHLYFNHSSLDCYDCSAYIKDTKDVFEWSKKHPALHAKKVIRINQVKETLNQAMEIYQ